MSKYRVIQNGYGFRGRYWEVGAVVEIDPAEKPPKYFQLIEDQSPVVEQPNPEVVQDKPRANRKKSVK